MAEEQNLVGQRLGNYALVRLLGKGGFAQVYLGEHMHLGSLAAIKVLHARLSSDKEVQQFLREAQLIASLDHPHIVRVLDFNVWQGTPYLVMEYAPRGTLHQLHPLGQGVALPEMMMYLPQVAAALQFAHERNLVHRDVKPDNMLLRTESTVALSDFGIAILAPTTGAQQQQSMAGTAPYMAPEQIQGRPGPASDQYALAVTVYRWITGRFPFQGTSLEIITQHMTQPVPPLRTFVPKLLPEIEAVVLKALAKDPQARYVTVRDFADAFTQSIIARLSESSSTAVLLPNLSPAVWNAIENDATLATASPEELQKIYDESIEAIEEAAELVEKEMHSFQQKVMLYLEPGQRRDGLQKIEHARDEISAFRQSWSAARRVRAKEEVGLCLIMVEEVQKQILQSMKDLRAIEESATHPPDLTDEEVAKLLVDIVRVEAETNKVTEVLAQEMSILAKLSQRPENAILRQGAHQVMEDALSAMEQSPEVSRIWDDIQDLSANYGRDNIRFLHELKARYDMVDLYKKTQAYYQTAQRQLANLQKLHQRLDAKRG